MCLFACLGRQSISRPMRIVAPIPKKFAEKEEKKKLFFARGNFTPFIITRFQIWYSFFPLLFPKDSKNQKKFGLWTFGRGGKKAFKRTKQMKKIRKKLFSPWRFYTLYEQKFSNLRPLLYITFHQGFQKSKNFREWTLGSGGKRPLNRVRNTEEG